MKAAQVARTAGINKETLRYYEKEGLITPPARQDNGYRAYTPQVLEELKFIRLAKSVGFTLKEIRPAIPFLRDPDPQCPTLIAHLHQQVARIDENIETLQQSRATLLRWLSKLETQSASDLKVGLIENRCHK
ncbi:MerR family transcriptional regulator [Natronospirillum operosum]|nr:MerR family transcriptional regulator [Natronospirillum operosum]